MFPYLDLEEVWPDIRHNSGEYAPAHIRTAHAYRPPKKGMSRYLPVWIEYIREFLRASVEDSISYVEVRMSMWYK